MKDIIFLYPANINSVRLQKIAFYLSEKQYKISYIGWNRYRKNILKDKKFSSIKYLLNGGGDGAKILPYMYVIFIIKLFFYLLFFKKISRQVFYAVNFETAFVMWAVSKFRKVHYIYDIWDEMAISHNFPLRVKKILRFFDKRMRTNADFYIHVDESRVSDIDSNNYIVIYNSPRDFYCNEELKKHYEDCFAVTGWLNNTRGLNSIFHFAKDNAQCKFIIIGEFIDKQVEQKFEELENVQFNHFMAQVDLFEKIKTCRGIFSLYDPSIEINKLAASNKLYDAMMMSTPVIVNNGILVAHFVQNNDIGYVVNYDYDDTWDVLKSFSSVDVAEKGSKGRALYIGHYEFNKILDDKFMPRLKIVIDSI